jgi:cytochrome bd-type quinol oxidase subunit 2
VAILGHACYAEHPGQIDGMLKWTRLRWVLLLAAIVAGHVAMWLSPRTTSDEALRLTLMNASIWAVVLLPAIGVSMWARAHRGRRGEGGASSEPAQTRRMPEREGKRSERFRPE